MNLHASRPWPQILHSIRFPVVLIVAALTASCSNNHSLTSPATDLGIYGAVETPNHVPAPGAMILVESYVDPIDPMTPHDFLARVRSIPDGGFGVGAVPAGQYTLLAGYSRVSTPAGGAFDSLVSYSIVTISDPTSNRIPVRLTLRPPATVVGRVISSASTVKYAYLVGMSGQISGASVDASGAFALEGAPQGTWRVMVYDISNNGASPALAATVVGVVTRSGETTRLRDIPIPSP